MTLRFRGRRRLIAALLIVTFFIVIFFAPPARAHFNQSASIQVRFNPDGTFQADLRTKAEVFFQYFQSETLTLANYRRLPRMPAPERVLWLAGFHQVFLNLIHFQCDGRRLAPQLEFPELTPETDYGGNDETWRFIWARYTGSAPPGSKAFTLVNGQEFGALLFRFYHQDGSSSTVEMLAENRRSRSCSLDFMRPPPGGLEVAWQFIVLGYTHILPGGFDHILFVLGLFLLSIRLKPLLWQVSAFTVAHSVTLGLCMYEVVSLPSTVIEPLIALSIVYVAVENIFTSELKFWRPAIVFAFGLLHGLGFAGALREIDLPREQLLTGLITFNVGVEFGQMSIILTAFLLVGWWRRRDWYRRRVVIPVSLLIAGTGLFWCAQRVLYPPV